MVHNTPNFPILTSATQETVGPGAYSPTSRSTPPEDVNFIMMPQHVRVSRFNHRYELSKSLIVALPARRWIASACPALRLALSRLASADSLWTLSQQHHIARPRDPLRTNECSKHVFNFNATISSYLEHNQRIQKGIGCYKSVSYSHGHCPITISKIHSRLVAQ
ncbi:unnamed protein product [Phytophthora fragariaefolia]|uniref:Unnamed protein product n=1 Tax=Phytophthora fragariaefolia TaxID=1490495 RepID=A0A9W6YBQ0_9STRA|nr:unnamed protein product [Phytophthora fragariaefolia]